MLEHFIPSPTGITNVETIADDARLTVYTPAGTMIRRSTGRATLKSLPKGIYIIKVDQARKTTTLRITQKVKMIVFWTSETQRLLQAGSSRFQT